MGKLYDAKARLEQVIRDRGLDASRLLGKISLRSGTLLALVLPDTPDDPAKLERLRAAAKELLSIDL